MRVPVRYALLLFLAAAQYASATSSTTTLIVSTNTAALGDAVTFSANISSATASGNVTFYDGASVLAIARVSAGTATFATRQLGAGRHDLRARYNGDAVLDSSVSQVVSMTVRSAASQGFIQKIVLDNLNLQSADFLAADFNGDARTDLAINDYSSRSLRILLGTAGGTFTIALPVPVPDQVVSMTASDFNGDGATDLAVLDATASARLFLGSGTGSFQAAGTIATGGTRLLSADMNNDGIVDLISAGGNTTNPNIGVLLGRGDGTFGLPRPIAPSFGTQAAIADFDGDGIADLVRDTFAPSGALGLEVLKGDGQGGLSSVYQWKATTRVYGIAAADWNADGAPDVLAIDGANLCFFAGKKDGTFVNPVIVVPSIGIGQLRVGDFDGDGLLDALAFGIAVGQGSSFVVATGDGMGHFALIPYNNNRGGLDSIIVGDFNGDARTDVLDLSTSILWLYAGGSPSDMAITMSHTATFGQGQTGDYTITVRNLGPNATSSGITAEVTLPPSWSRVSMSGIGWNCPQSYIACSRTDALAPGASYPPIQLTVRVSATAPAVVSPRATVRVENLLDPNPANDMVKDITAIRQNQFISFGTIPDRALGAPSFALTAIASSGLPVTFIASGACATTGVTVTLPSAGTCIVLASQAGNEAFFPAADVTRTFQIGSTPSLLDLTANSVVRLGEQTTLQARIQPAGSTGRVLFYDGFTVLGSAAVANGTASLIIRTRATGMRQLRARFVATGASMGAVSAIVNQQVRPQPNMLFTSSTIPGSTLFTTIELGDVNNDSNLDLIGASTFALGVSLGDGKGGFGTTIRSVQSASLATLRQVLAGDFNSDGVPDVATVQQQSSDPTQQGLRIWTGKGDGSFTAGPVVPMEVGQLVVADFSGDGRLDVAVAQPIRQGINVLYGKGDGSLEPAIFFPVVTAGGAIQIATGDVNNDGSLDLVVTTRGNPDVASEVLIQVLVGNRTGTFSKAAFFHKEAAATSPQLADQMALGDLNADGVPDLVIAQDGCAILALTGTGTGEFQAAKRVPCGIPDTGGNELLGAWTSLAGIAIADFDGDGREDVAAPTNGLSAYLQFFRGSGNGALLPASVYRFPSLLRSSQLLLGDLDGDGRMDMVTSGNQSTAVIRGGGGGPLLQLSLTASPALIQTRTGETVLTLSASNAGNASTSGEVAVSLAFLQYAAFSPLAGSGWNCIGLKCTRSDALAAGGSYPPITARLSLSIDTTQTLSATIYGGDSTPATAQSPIRSKDSKTGRISSVLTASSFMGNRIAPNGWTVILGDNLVPANTPAEGVIWNKAPDFASGRMPTDLNGVRVTVADQPAYVYFYCSAATSPVCTQDQINVLVPPNLATGVSLPVKVIGTNVGYDGPIVAPVNPTFLTFGGGSLATATHADYSLVGPTYLYPGYTTPARPGEAIILWAVGFGLPVDPITPGSATQRGPLPLPLTCTAGGKPAPAAVNLVSPGLYQVNLTLSGEIALDPAFTRAYVDCKYGDTLFGGVILEMDPN